MAGYDETKEEDKLEDTDYKFETEKEKEKQDFARKMQERNIRKDDDVHSKSTQEQILEMESISDDVRVTSITPDPDPDTFARKDYSKNIVLVGKVANKMGDEAIEILHSSYPDAGRNEIIELGIIEKGQRKGELGMRLFGEKRGFEPIKNKDGSFRKSIRKELRENLGPNADQADKQVDEAWEKFHKDGIIQQSIVDDPNRTEDEKNDAREKLRKIEIGKEKLRKRENYLSKFKSLGERIKTFFKTKGIAIAIVLSVGAVIAEIILNLTSGVKSGLKAVKNGLKDIGKKLANLLTGMIGSIVSFIFSKASEVVGFLAKNVWLLILAVVIYFVEQFKNKNK